jgi:hypothetical protein
LFPVAALAGATFAGGHVHYPLFMNQQYTPLQNAELVTQISTAVAVLFASIASFWTLRNEIATQSINAFVFGARPVTIALALILYGAATAFVAWFGGIGVTAMLTTAAPAHLPLLVIRTAVGVLAGSALGALAVTVSTQPVMIISTYLGCMVLFPVIQFWSTSRQLTTAGVFCVVVAAIASLLLERRCAT